MGMAGVKAMAAFNIITVVLNHVPEELRTLPVELSACSGSPIMSPRFVLDS